jgi:hypothetical protein
MDPSDFKIKITNCRITCVSAVVPFGVGVTSEVHLISSAVNIKLAARLTNQLTNTMDQSIC